MPSKPEKKSPKRKYEPPRLVVHGNIESLTAKGANAKESSGGTKSG